MPLIDDDDDLGLLVPQQLAPVPPAQPKRARDHEPAVQQAPRNPAQRLPTQGGGRGDGVSKMAALAFGTLVSAAPPCAAVTMPAATHTVPLSPPEASSVSVVAEPPTLPRTVPEAEPIEPTPTPVSPLEVAAKPARAPVKPAATTMAPLQRSASKKPLDKAAQVTPKIDAFFAKFAKK